MIARAFRWIARMLATIAHHDGPAISSQDEEYNGEPLGYESGTEPVK